MDSSLLHSKIFTLYRLISVLTFPKIRFTSERKYLHNNPTKPREYVTDHATKAGKLTVLVFFSNESVFGLVCVHVHTHVCIGAQLL